MHPTSAEPENFTANTESAEQPSIPSEPSLTTNPPTNHISDPPQPELEPSKVDPIDTNGDLSGTHAQPASSIDAPPSDAPPSSVNDADVVAPVSDEPVSGEKPLGEEHGTGLVEPPVTADPVSSEKPHGEEQGTSNVEPSVSDDPVSSEKPLKEQETGIDEPTVSANPVASEKPHEAEQDNSLVEPPVGTDPVSSEKPVEEQGTSVVETPANADPVTSEKLSEEEKGASVVEPPASADSVPDEKPLEAEQGTSAVEPSVTADPTSDQKPLPDEQAAKSSLEGSVGKDVPTATEDTPPTDITHGSDNLPEAPPQSIPTADAPAVPETSTGVVEPSVSADPTSGQEPFQKEQGADRPLEEPTGEQAAGITDEKVKTEDTQAGGNISGAPTTTELSDPADQSEKPIEPVSHVTEEKGVEGDSKDSVTGEQYVKSTGLAADGGNFDAAKPGAGKEADRKLLLFFYVLPFSVFFSHSVISISTLCTRMI